MTKLIIKYDDGGSFSNLTTNNAIKGFLLGGGYGMIALGFGGFVNKFPTPNADLNNNNLIAALAREGVSDVLLMSGNPYAMAAGAAVKVIDKTGGFTDVSKGLGTGTDIANALASFALPGAGWFMNNDKTDDYKMSADMKVMSRGYAGSVKDALTAESNAGAKLLFGRNKANNMIAEAKFKDALISQIKQSADADFQTARSMTQQRAIANQYALMGGYHQAYARAGKFGLKLERTKQLAIKFKEPAEIKEQEVYVMKDGGEFFANLRESFIPTTEEQNQTFFDTLLTEEDIQKFLKGGEVKKIKSNKSYYDKDNNIIYYTDDESAEHENFHANPDKELLQLLAPYYSDLNDDRIIELGGDLEFVKRFENDPNHFYAPEELGARITAAKFRTKGQEYTPEFFANLRKNENQYGDNMRDLLHMYDDKTLAKIFNIRERRDRIAKLMKDVIEPAAKAGNKTAMRLMDMDQNSYTFTDNDVENGYKGKVGDVGNVYIGHDPKLPYIVPGIQYVNDKLLFISNPWKDGPNEQWIQFPSNEDAAFFGENYHDFPELVPTLANWKKKFKEGGLMNVIPEGSLHARLHHMDNADNLTKKGIPVVDNKGNQQAEIEHSEIIFTKEVTDKLEELYKKFKSDEYTNKEKENFAIEAGKLLSKEIIENTDDRVGLLNADKFAEGGIFGQPESSMDPSSTSTTAYTGEEWFRRGFAALNTKYPALLSLYIMRHAASEGNNKTGHYQLGGNGGNVKNTFKSTNPSSMLTYASQMMNKYGGENKFKAAKSWADYLGLLFRPDFLYNEEYSTNSKYLPMKANSYRVNGLLPDEAVQAYKSGYNQNNFVKSKYGPYTTINNWVTRLVADYNKNNPKNPILNIDYTL